MPQYPPPEPPITPPEPDDDTSDWGLGDCLEFLGLDTPEVDLLIDYLSASTLYAVLEDLRRAAARNF